MKPFLPAALLILAACQGTSSLIIHHAKIIPVDSKGTIAEAMFIRDGRIVAIGSDEEIFKFSEGSSTRVIDAEGNPVLPGLYDSHVHLLGASTSEHAGPLPEFKSLDDAYAYIKK